MAENKTVNISAPNLQVAEFHLRGTTPYVQHKFSVKAEEQMRQKQEAGSQAKKGQKREAKDFTARCEEAKHKTADGKCGMPASGFRCAMISACRLCGFQMTKAKLACWIQADGFDATSGDPLVFFTKGEPHYSQHYVRLATGVVDIAARPMWDAGWEAMLRVQYDADMFSETDIANLLSRVGMQVGIGEGRPDSKNSCGMGWGLFELL